jgi:hypothetical protein
MDVAHLDKSSDGRQLEWMLDGFAVRWMIRWFRWWPADSTKRCALPHIAACVHSSSLFSLSTVPVLLL